MNPSESAKILWSKNYISRLHTLIHDDMQLVDELIRKNLQSDVTLINKVAGHIIDSGGKRLRPTLLLLAARHFSYAGSQHTRVAAIIEFIHTATLLHDDVVDASLLRHGRETANQLWGNEASVLIGDFLYSRAFQMMVETDSMRVMDVLSETTNTIAEGEVRQLLHRHNPDISHTDYIEVIRSKTAKLFEAASRLGAILGESKPEDEQKMASYGMHLGMAFQLIDDVLDYKASSNVLGKSVGNDLTEGRPTLPLIYAMQNSKEQDNRIIRQAILKQNMKNINTILEIIKKTKAIEYTVDLATKEAESAIQALQQFPAGKYLDAMYNLAEFAIERQF